MSLSDALFIMSMVIICVLIVFCLICCVCCIAFCDDENEPTQNQPTNRTDPTPLVRREIYVICVDETSTRQREEPETQRTNEIPAEYANIKPQETVSGWRQGQGMPGIPSDARVPDNAQPPTISDDDL